MRTITLYGLKNCDTCKKALKALAAAGRDVTFVDIRAEADLAAKLPTWLASVDADVLVNKRSTTWRELDDASRADADADGEAGEAHRATTLCLIKRPVIEAGETIHVGWTAAVSAALT